MQPHSIEPHQEEEDRPKANWKRRILIGAACLLGLLVVGWWIISSEMFLRGVVMKSHGSADEEAILAAIGHTLKACQARLPERIAGRVRECGAVL